MTYPPLQFILFGTEKLSYWSQRVIMEGLNETDETVYNLFSGKLSRAFPEVLVRSTNTS